jgi:hypothetical protein
MAYPHPACSPIYSRPGTGGMHPLRIPPGCWSRRYVTVVVPGRGTIHHACERAGVSMSANSANLNIAQATVAAAICCHCGRPSARLGCWLSTSAPVPAALLAVRWHCPAVAVAGPCGRAGWWPTLQHWALGGHVGLPPIVENMDVRGHILWRIRSLVSVLNLPP